MASLTEKSDRLISRILLIGAGSRGFVYGEAITTCTNAVIVAVAEPDEQKRVSFARKYITGGSEPDESQMFTGWHQFVQWETIRRKREADGLDAVATAINTVFICVLDDLHKEVIVALKPFDFHIMCEKPLATTLSDCSAILRLVSDKSQRQRLFAIGHVLRYTPHNMLLKKILSSSRSIGEIMSIEHTEPVGWWHFAHSFVRGNWRKESTSAPSLLTKSCHDIDLLLWMINSHSNRKLTNHPQNVSSTGDVQYFRSWSKPKLAGTATNCLSCAAEKTCKFSAKRMYVGPGKHSLAAGNTGWPVNVVVPQIEDIVLQGGKAAGERAVLDVLKDDYRKDTTQNQVDSNSWYGRCVYESSNDVCDDQSVTINWKELIDPTTGDILALPKKVSFHMVALSSKVCQRYSHIYGTDGEIIADGETITVKNFTEDTIQTFSVADAQGGHKSGDDGLTSQFVLAVEAVLNDDMDVEEAQMEYIGCGAEDIIMSHAIIFAAEEARVSQTVVNWNTFWNSKVVAVAGIK